MQGQTIAILENRVGAQMAELVRKRGGEPFCAPALAQLPDLDAGRIRELVQEWATRPPDVFVFQTGVGVKALFAATDALGLTDELLDKLASATVAVRGPKPTAALRARKVRIDLAAGDPFTTREVLAELDADVALRGKRVLVQRYGESNVELQQALEARGAQVSELATYRWAVPEDRGPLLALVDALEQHRIAAVAFTSASQVANLHEVARQAGRAHTLSEGLARTLVASIGPVCSGALRQHAVRIDVEASPPKLGPFLNAIDEALSAPRNAP